MTHVPDEARNALRAIEDAFGEPCFAAYLSGSAFDGGLRPMSDVDVLVVVEDVPDEGARRRLAAWLMRVSGRYGGGGLVRPLDVTLLRRADVVPWRCPPVPTFVYGEWLRAAYEAGHILAAATHPDLAIALAQTRAIGVALHGPAQRELLDPVHEADLQRALRDARLARRRGPSGVRHGGVDHSVACGDDGEVELGPAQAAVPPPQFPTAGW